MISTPPARKSPSCSSNHQACSVGGCRPCQRRRHDDLDDRLSGVPLREPPTPRRSSTGVGVSSPRSSAMHSRTRQRCGPKYSVPAASSTLTRHVHCSATQPGTSGSRHDNSDEASPTKSASPSPVHALAATSPSTPRHQRRHRSDDRGSHSRILRLRPLQSNIPPDIRSRAIGGASAPHRRRSRLPRSLIRLAASFKRPRRLAESNGVMNTRSLPLTRSATTPPRCSPRRPCSTTTRNRFSNSSPTGAGETSNPSSASVPSTTTSATRSTSATTPTTTSQRQTSSPTATDSATPKQRC